ncbi:L-amino acid N-acyltransferase YncA [Bradyrhizobium sp. JR6.1]
MRCCRSTAITSATASRRASTIPARRSPTTCATAARICATPACRIWSLCDGEVVGYAYVVQFRKRPAYRYTVKHSIYIHHRFTGKGVGGRLLQELVDTCAAAGFRQMIGYIDSDNAASLALHERFGFARVGHLPGVAYRYGRWSDTVMVQRSLAAGSTAPPPPAPLSRR